MHDESSVKKSAVESKGTSSNTRPLYLASRFIGTAFGFPLIGLAGGFLGQEIVIFIDWGADAARFVLGE